MVREGVLLKTQYSGMGCAEMAWEAVRLAVLDRTRIRVPTTRLLESCDLSTPCQKVLLADGGPGTVADHVYGDIMDRLPAAAKFRLKKMFWPDKDWVTGHTP